LPLTLFTQTNFVADFLQAKSDFSTQIGRFAFFRPPLGDLGAVYDNHLSGLLSSINWTFFSLGVTVRRYERLPVQNRRFCSNGGRLTQNFR